MKFLCHPHQFGKRSSLHFMHHSGSMNLNGDFAGTEFRGNLLIEQSGNYQTHYFSLAPRQHFRPGSQRNLLRFCYGERCH